MKCPVCNSINILYFDSYRANNIIFQGVDKDTCIDCGLVFTSPMPNQKELERYNSNYFEEAHGGFAKGRISQLFFNAISKIRGRYISEFLFKYKINPAEVLEIGPGHGFFAKNWISNYAGVSYSVIETDATCYPMLNNVGVKVFKSFEEIQIKPQKDLVVMSHVLEHVSSPLELIRNISGVMLKGGVIFIEVPCRDYLYKKIDEPHLLFFDKQSLHKLLEGAGFGCIETTYHGELLEEINPHPFFNKKILAIITRLKIILMLLRFIKLENMESSVLKPFQADKQQNDMSRWIRAIAIKN